MVRLLFITYAMVCVVFLASDAVSVRASAEAVTPDPTASTLGVLDTKETSKTNPVHLKTTGQYTSAPIPEEDECDPTNGHSCTSHLLSLGQSAMVSGVGQKDAHFVAMIAAPDDREKSGLFRPPISLS